MKSSFLLLLILFISIFRNCSGWRSQTSTSSVSSTFSGDRIAKKEKSKPTIAAAADAGEQLNIGLLAPHTTFGKREYSKAFTSAIGNLQKMRDTKLGFLHNYEFKANNVHFNMIPLTPSPISKFYKTISHHS